MLLGDDAARVVKYSSGFYLCCVSCFVTAKAG